MVKKKDYIVLYFTILHYMFIVLLILGPLVPSGEASVSKPGWALEWPTN